MVIEDLAVVGGDLGLELGDLGVQVSDVGFEVGRLDVEDVLGGLLVVAEGRELTGELVDELVDQVEDHVHEVLVGDDLLAEEGDKGVDESVIFALFAVLEV